MKWFLFRHRGHLIYFAEPGKPLNVSNVSSSLGDPADYTPARFCVDIQVRLLGVGGRTYH